MASIDGLVNIPNNSFRFEAGVEVSGIASAAVSAGDVVVSTDGVNWGLAGVDEDGHTGVVMENPVAGPDFASGAMLSVRIWGGVVVVATAAVINEGDLISTAAAGEVVAQVLDSATVATLAADIPRTIGKAVTAVDGTGGKIIIMLRGA